MELVYGHLVRDTLLPSDPLVVGAAALAAGGSNGAELPSWFGNDVERDGAWLAERLPAEGPWWSIFEAMARAADKPHTGFMDPVRGAGMGALQKGRPRVAPGFGLARQTDLTLAIVDVAAGGSAELSGLRPGDQILAIDGSPPRASGLEILRFYPAPVGQRFALDVRTADSSREVELVLLPGEVPGVTHGFLESGLLYLNIRWFATSEEPEFDTAELVRKALKDDRAAAASGLVIDLRNGMGGSLRAVREIISALGEAEEAVAILGESGEPEQYPRIGETIWRGQPIAVLVNEQSTSAAEFLAVGLEELLGATLVGTPTSGGLNFLGFVPLADDHNLVIPAQAGLGPRSLAPRPSHRLMPSVEVPNPTGRELAAGQDAQLEAAVRVVLRPGHKL